MKAPSTPCPSCGTDYTVRIATQGVLERTAKVFYLYPFRCKLCDARFRAFKYGVTYIRRDVDRRQFQRIDTEFPVTLRLEGINGQAVSLNVSAEGCLLRTETQFSIGDVVTLNLKILEGEAPLLVDAAIIRSVQGDRCSIEFLQMGSMARLNLGRFIEHHLVQDYGPAALAG